jgi:hypothetical protein
VAQEPSLGQGHAPADSGAAPLPLYQGWTAAKESLEIMRTKGRLFCDWCDCEVEPDGFVGTWRNCVTSSNMWSLGLPVDGATTYRLIKDFCSAKCAIGFLGSEMRKSKKDVDGNGDMA